MVTAKWSHLSAGECNVTFLACVWQFITRGAQGIISFVINDNSSQCEKNVVKAATCLKASCGDTTKNGLDKQSNKDKDLLCNADDPRGIGGLLPGNKYFYDPENVHVLNSIVF